MAVTTRGIPFALGHLSMTRGVAESLSPLSVMLALARHVRGDWGDLDSEDKQANNLALLDGTRLLSCYSLPDIDGKSTRVYVITEADRSATTVMLPEEY